MPETHDATSTLLAAGDTALRAVGTAKLWWDIASGVVVFGVLIALLVTLLRYHQRWKSEQAEVHAVHCDAPKAITTCEKGGCTTHHTQYCTLALDGFSAAFKTNYAAGAVPKAGDTVKVFFNPSDRSEALLAKDDFFDDHKAVLAWSLVGLGLVVVVSVGVQFALRKNRTAQRVAGGAALFTLATGHGF